MQIYPKPKTDEEYVELIRKHVRRSKWFAVFFCCGFILFLVVIWWFLSKIYSVTSPITIPGSNEVFNPGINIGMRNGVIIGFFIGIWFGTLAIINMILAIQCFVGDKTERLMLKFYDELKKEDK